MLVVDDDADYRLVTRLALEPHPLFQVVGEADSGAAAARAAVACSPDLVLLECSSGDAFDALADIRAAAPGARVVLVSGFDPAELHLASRAAGALGWLGKATPARRLGTELQALVGLVDAVSTVLEEARTRLQRDLTSPRAARQFVRQALARYDLDDLTDTVGLLASELVTNAVVHSGGDVEVMVRLTGDGARVEVTDPSDVMPVPQQAGADDESGRGLALVEAMARSWGVTPAPDGGKTVWFEVARNP